MNSLTRVYVNPTDDNAQAFVAALITHPSKYEIVSSSGEADLEASELMPTGTLATWTTSYFVVDAEIGAEDLVGQTIEISIENAQSSASDDRFEEIDSVLNALGINTLENAAKTLTANSVMLAGFHKGSEVTVAHRTVSVGKARLYISICGPQLRVVLDAPLGATAEPPIISGYSATGTSTLRPVYRSAISRWLANH